MGRIERIPITINILNQKIERKIREHERTGVAWRSVKQTLCCFGFIRVGQWRRPRKALLAHHRRSPPVSSREQIIDFVEPEVTLDRSRSPNDLQYRSHPIAGFAHHLQETEKALIDGRDAFEIHDDLSTCFCQRVTKMAGCHLDLCGGRMT